MKENEIPQSDLITISTFKKSILELFRYLFRILDFIIDSIRRNIGLFIFCCILGLGIGFFFYYIRPKGFQSHMMVIPNELTRRDFHAILSNLDQQLSSKFYEDLTDDLNLNLEEVEKIHSVKAFNLDGSSMKKDTSTRFVHPFMIEVRGEASMNKDSVQAAILDYLNNNPYLNQIKKGQKQVYLEKLEYIEKEQRKLDSLKTSYNIALASMQVPSTTYNNALNPADIYVQSNNLENQKESIMHWLNTRSQAVQLVDGMKTPQKVGSMPLILHLSGGLLLGSILGFFLCLLAVIRRIINKPLQ